MWFLNAPVSQTGLFGDAVEHFVQQFSTAEKQTEAISCCLHPASGGSVPVYSSPRVASCVQAMANLPASGRTRGPETGDQEMHLIPPSEHTHKRGAQGAVGGSVPCSRVSPHSPQPTFTPPHLQSLPDMSLEPTTFGVQVRLSNY